MQFVYILTNKKNGTLYVGTTRNLEHRILEHNTKKNKGFTEKYSLNKLVYYEEYELAIDGILREKHIKKWKRQWKINLIEKNNPKWKDLSKNWD